MNFWLRPIQSSICSRSNRCSAAPLLALFSVGAELAMALLADVPEITLSFADATGTGATVGIPTFAASPTAGKCIVKAVPRPGSLATPMNPLLWRTMP